VSENELTNAAASLLKLMQQEPDRVFIPVVGDSIYELQEKGYVSRVRMADVETYQLTRLGRGAIV
jgi:hypothetical protein